MVGWSEIETVFWIGDGTTATTTGSIVDSATIEEVLGVDPVGTVWVRLGCGEIVGPIELSGVDTITLNISSVSRTGRTDGIVVVADTGVVVGITIRGNSGTVVGTPTITVEIDMLGELVVLMCPSVLSRGWGVDMGMDLIV